jgi:hypothetical protein
MIMEIYIKGKYEHGIGAAAYVVVAEGNIVAQGSRRLGADFALCGQQFPCDQFNCELLAAVCGIAHCGEEKMINVYSNNKSVIAWLSRGGEPDGRKRLLDIWRKYADGKDVLVDWIPFFERDASGNEWNRLCNELAAKSLKDE